MCVKILIFDKKKKDETTKREKFAGIAKDAWNPMQLDDPKLEDRVTLLARWTPGSIPDEKARNYLYGLHNDWIDMHTLREYMLFLSQDIRSGNGKKKGPEKRPVLTEAEEAAVASAEVMVPEEMEEMADHGDTEQMDTGE